MSKIYQEVTDRIIVELEKGALPAVPRWDDAQGGMPYNVTTGKAYRGVNVLLLWIAAANNAFPSGRFLTYRQAQAAGGQVRKGETGTRIIKYGTFEKEGSMLDASGQPLPEQVGFLKGYTVFHVSQCDGLPDTMQDQPRTAAPATAIDFPLGGIVAGGSVDLKHDGNQACFIPSRDQVHMPPPERFYCPALYHATLAHELVHWSGGKARLDRTFGKRFGDRAYCAEELVAELGAAMLCAVYGIEGDMRHAGYLQKYIDLLQADNRAIVTAASAASKAADYLRDLDTAAVLPLAA